MRTVIRKFTHFLSKILRRVTTDSIKQLLRCFFQSMQDVEFVV